MQASLKLAIRRQQLADIVDPEKRSEMMAGIRSKNTRPEKIVRKTLHAQGYRFRLHRKDLPGKPDIVLPKWKTVVFVHGCFWHGHDNCPLYRLPKSQAAFWEKKITSNRIRDAKTEEKLAGLGWRVVEIWECASKGRAALSAEDLCLALDGAIKTKHRSKIEIRGAQIA